MVAVVVVMEVMEMMEVLDKVPEAFAFLKPWSIRMST